MKMEGLAFPLVAQLGKEGKMCTIFTEGENACICFFGQLLKSCP